MRSIFKRRQDWYKEQAESKAVEAEAVEAEETDEATPVKEKKTRKKGE